MEIFNTRKAIVTGACGFLGRKLTSYLSDNNVEVIALDYSDQFTPLGKNIRFIKIDIMSPEFFDCLITEYDIDVLFHTAWIGVNAADRSNYEKQLINIGLTLRVLQFAEKLKIKKTVVLGSASEYASCGEIINGYNKFAPVDGYGVAKVACHILCYTWAKQNGCSLIWTVISSIYGPGRDDNNILTYTIKTLLKGERPSYTKLEQLWDYIYIDDLVEALVAIGEKGVQGHIYPIGYGRAKPLKEYIKYIRDKIDPSLSLGIGEIPYKSGVPENSQLDVSQLNYDIVFLPQTNFDEGIEKTISFFRQRMFNK